MKAGAAYRVVEGEADTVEFELDALTVEDADVEGLEIDDLVFDFDLFGFEADLGPCEADFFELDFV